MKFFPILLTVCILGCQQPNVPSENEDNKIPINNYSTESGVNTKDLIPSKVLNYLQTNMVGWVLPDTSDYVKAWWSFYNKNQIPFFVSTDINDDNIADYGFILKNNDSLRLVILIGKGDSFIYWIAEDFKESFVQKELQFGLSVQPPGRVDCVVRNKDQSIVLRSNNIALMQFEVMLNVYYWKDNKMNLFIHNIYPD